MLTLYEEYSRQKNVHKQRKVTLKSQQNYFIYCFYMNLTLQATTTIQEHLSENWRILSPHSEFVLQWWLHNELHFPQVSCLHSAPMLCGCSHCTFLPIICVSLTKICKNNEKSWFVMKYNYCLLILCSTSSQRGASINLPVSTPATCITSLSFAYPQNSHD